MAASSLEASGRDELKIRSVAAGLFETLDAMPRVSFDVDFDETVREAIATMGGKGDTLRGYKVVAVAVASDNGARLVQLTLSRSSVAKKAPFVARKFINKLSEKTAGEAFDG
jgi:hypothetical protein